MNMQKEQAPSVVCESTKQEGEATGIRSNRWSWVEPAAWTEPMLEALEHGRVKGGKWFSLIDKIGKTKNLEAALRRVKENKGGAGIDHVTPAVFEREAAANLQRLQNQLQAGTYQPQAIRRVYIPKPGSGEKRPLGIPTVRDRVMQAATRQVIEPIFEHEFKDCSYGFRPGRSSKDALRAVDAKLKEGRTIVVDTDIRNFFGSVKHDTLMALVERRIADSRVLELIRGFLEQRVLDEPLWEPTGTPQGAVISPLLANIYLHELDVVMTNAGLEMVRYADDLVVLCRTEDEAEEALGLLRCTLERLSLEMHPEKTRVVNMQHEGARFTFLGYEFVRSGRDGRLKRYPSKKSEKKLRERIRKHTRRTNRHSLAKIVAGVNPILRGWYEYFRNSSSSAFEATDSWVRARLRSILEKRNHHRNRGHGMAHRRYPNAYFNTNGLFCLSMAHTIERRSVTR